MRKVLFSMALAAMTLSVCAQQEQKSIKLPDWLSNVKLSGYGMMQYEYNGQASTKADAHGQDRSNTFNLRMLRVSLEGRIINDFYWKTQIQFNGNTSNLGSSPRVVDLFVEWQKYDFARIKVGQFKRPFTFENPMNPIDQGFRSYSQNVSALAGFSDRAGAHASNGRDIGIQLQGDFLKIADRNWLHYQVGVYNGQGINTKDVDQQKDLIGGLWIMPVKGMRIGAFGWTGSYARNGYHAGYDADNNVITAGGKKVVKLQQRRYAFSAEYKVSDWTFRSEYIHSTGYAFKKALSNTNDATSTDANVNTAAGDKAEGVYALTIAPILKNKLYAKARYDMYRSDGSAATQKTFYEVGLNYKFHKNIQINAEYALVHDRTLLKDNYNMAEVELDFRF